MPKSLIRKEYPSVTAAELRKINSYISNKCSEYYFLGFLRCSNGNVNDALGFFFLDERLRALLTQYLMRFEIQIKSDFAKMVEKATRSKQFWKVSKYYTPTARLRRPGKRSFFYITKNNVQNSIDKMSPLTIGPLNYVAMYSISFGCFETVYRYIDTAYEQDFIDKYTSHLPVHTYDMLLHYFECIRVLRNRCAHGNHIITKKFADQLFKYGGRYIINNAYSPMTGVYLSYFETVLFFLIKQLSCGNEFRKELKKLIKDFSTLLATYPSRHSLSANTVSKIL